MIKLGLGANRGDLALLFHFRSTLTEATNFNKKDFSFPFRKLNDACRKIFLTIAVEGNEEEEPL